MHASWRLMVAMGVVAGLSACVDDSQPAAQAGDAPRAEQAQGNSAPRISGVPGTWAVSGSVWSFKPLASDPDGDTLTFTATGLPAWASINSSTGLLSGAPTDADVGVTADIFISVSDGRTSATLAPFRIDIQAAAVPSAPSAPSAPTAPANPATPAPSNQPPAISGSPATTVLAGSSYSFRPTASDPEGSTLRFSIAGKPAWAAFSTTTGTLSGKPASSQAGVYSNITISVSDGTLTASLPAFSITVTAPNSAPNIAGTPATSAVTGSSYSFVPTASDPDGNTLAFSITGKPSWATFSTATGALTGTAQAGTFANIVISVTDGTATRSLPAFTLTVGSANTGEAALSWSAPTQNADGSPLTDLAGYRVYHGTSADNFSEIVEIAGSNNTSYSFTKLAKGTHYFAVASFNTEGIESELSAVGSKTIQ